MLNDKNVMNRLVTFERRVLKSSMHTILEVHDLFTSYKLEWMERSVGSYIEEILREFYASYVATLRGALDKTKLVFFK